MSSTETPASLTFSGLGLAPKLLAVLERLRFTVPTPIQYAAIPVAVTGKDVIGIAQTGTGKTLAFALPLIQQIARTKGKGLIILPTRELAMQVDEFLQQVGHSLGVRKALVIGGASLYLQTQLLRKDPHIIIGTPGRIIDHLEQGTLDLKKVSVLVLDEADRMLDMGFAPQIKRIIQAVPKDRQTMLFSATMPAEIVHIAAQHMKMPVRVEVAPAGTVAEKVSQELFIVSKEQKSRLLDTILAKYAGTVLVFSRTKHGAKKLCRALRDRGHSAAEIHSNLSLSQRKRSLEGFKSGSHRVLVATDIAARGIDVTNIELVVNYDLPDNLDDYVHRIGRTGRAGRSGSAISFITPDQKSKIRLIERLARSSLRVSPLPDLPAEYRGAGGTPYQAQETRISQTHRRTTFRHAPQRQDSRRSDSAPRRASNRARRQARVHI